VCDLTLCLGYRCSDC